MKSRILNKAVSILMIGIALAGTLISCDGAANAIPQDMEEVEVKASVIDETKSLEAYFGETVANNVTHYRWVMTHKNPTRVYDTGYVPRATAEAHQMFANMNGTHKILTGEYDWTFSGYVYDGVGSGDANYHKVAEVSNTGEIINAKTQSVAIELNTLVGQNQGAEITAILPVDFYNAYTANSNRLHLTVSAADTATGSPATITGDQGSLSATGIANQLKLTLGSLPTGSYRLTVQIDLLNEALIETVDSKTAVSVLRSVSGSVAKGEMNFASTTLNGAGLKVQLVDVTGDSITAGATMDSYVISGLNESYMNSTTADVTLNYPHVEGVSVKWYIDGVEAGAEKISAVRTNGDDTTYTIQVGAIEEGDHILTATLINENFNMSAGSVSFKVTVKEAEIGGGTGAEGVEGAVTPLSSDVQNKTIRMMDMSNGEGNYACMFFSDDGNAYLAMDVVPKANSTPVENTMQGSCGTWSVGDGKILIDNENFMFNELYYVPSRNVFVALNGESAYDMPIIDAGSLSDTLLAQYAALGIDYGGTPSLLTTEMKGYWEQCGSDGSEISPAKMWVWLGGEPSDTLMEQAKNAAFGALLNGTAQGTQIASRWNLHGPRNMLSIIVADTNIPESERQDPDTLCYTFEVSKSGNIYALKVIYSMNYNDPNLTVGNTYYFKSAVMGSSVESALKASGVTV